MMASSALPLEPGDWSVNEGPVLAGVQVSPLALAMIMDRRRRQALPRARMLT